MTSGPANPTPGRESMILPGSKTYARRARLSAMRACCSTSTTLTPSWLSVAQGDDEERPGHSSQPGTRTGCPVGLKPFADLDRMLAHGLRNPANRDPAAVGCRVAHGCEVAPVLERLRGLLEAQPAQLRASAPQDLVHQASLTPTGQSEIGQGEARVVPGQVLAPLRDRRIAPLCRVVRVGQVLDEEGALDGLWGHPE